MYFCIEHSNCFSYVDKLLTQETNYPGKETRLNLTSNPANALVIFDRVTIFAGFALSCPEEQNLKKNLN